MSLGPAPTGTRVGRDCSASAPCAPCTGHAWLRKAQGTPSEDTLSRAGVPFHGAVGWACGLSPEHLNLV